MKQISLAVLAVVLLQFYLHHVYVINQPKLEIVKGVLIDSRETDNQTPIYDANSQVTTYVYSTSYYLIFDVNGVTEKMSVSKEKYLTAVIGKEYTFPCKEYRDYYDFWTVVVILCVIANLGIIFYLYETFN